MGNSITEITSVNNTTTTAIKHSSMADSSIAGSSIAGSSVSSVSSVSSAIIHRSISSLLANSSNTANNNHSINHSRTNSMEVSNRIKAINGTHLYLISIVLRQPPRILKVDKPRHSSRVSRVATSHMLLCNSHPSTLSQLMRSQHSSHRSQCLQTMNRLQHHQ
jgi:hypothetical protein